jgi:hypothetical protein
MIHMILYLTHYQSVWEGLIPKISFHHRVPLSRFGAAPYQGRTGRNVEDVLAASKGTISLSVIVVYSVLAILRHKVCHGNASFHACMRLYLVILLYSNQRWRCKNTKTKNIFIWTFTLLKNHKLNRVLQQYKRNDVDFRFLYILLYYYSIYPDFYHIIIYIISLTTVFLRITPSKIWHKYRCNMQTVVLNNYYTLAILQYD